jgi:hypothetical protein
MHPDPKGRANPSRPFFKGGEDYMAPKKELPQAALDNANPNASGVPLGILRVASTLNNNGLAFIEANDPSSLGDYEVQPDLSEELNILLNEFGVDETVEKLSQFADTADAIRLVWEHLDESYVSVGPNNTDVNEAFVQLGLVYVDYLENGGDPLTFDTVKFEDGAREQNMHDNLLGNITEAALNQRDLFDDYGSQVPQEYLDRAYYSGNATAKGGPDHDAVRAFDYDKGWDREDYIDRFIGEVDDRATNNGDGEEMIFGDGNFTDNYTIARHEGAGIELALKAKERGEGNYDAPVDNGDGTFTYMVETGEDATDRAEWNIDWAATVTEAGDDSVDDFEFKFYVDIDPTIEEELVDLSGSGTQYYDGTFGTVSDWNETDLQNSWNNGFFGPEFFDPDTEGQYAAKLEAYDDGELIAAQTIYVETMGFTPPEDII